jgi:hypothetical protein
MPMQPSSVLTSSDAAMLTGLYSETDKGTYVIHDEKIFKAGKFTASNGKEVECTTDDIDQMIANFELLRDGGLFPNVPIRLDHSASVKDVIGYFVSMRRVGKFLVADLEITEEQHFSKWLRGTYRSKSVEIGPYVSNDESLYHPVVRGVAFVDLPAVEGLFASGNRAIVAAADAHFRQAMLDLGSVTDYESGKPQGIPGGSEDQMGTTGSQISLIAPSDLDPAVADTDLLFSQAATEIVEPESAGETPADDEADGEPETPAAAAADDAEGVTDGEEAAPVGDETSEGGADERPEDEQGIGDPGAAGVEAGDREVPEEAELSQAPQETFCFSINGAQVTDFAAVQAHITALETFRRETIEHDRREFVAGLVRDNMILANQSDALTSLAVSMTDTQFSEFKTAYQHGAAAPLLGSYGASGGKGPDATTADKAEIETLEEIVTQHLRAGKTLDEVQKFDSYQRLQKLQGEQD